MSIRENLWLSRRPELLSQALDSDWESGLDLAPVQSDSESESDLESALGSQSEPAVDSATASDLDSDWGSAPVQESASALDSAQEFARAPDSQLESQLRDSLLPSLWPPA